MRQQDQRWNVQAELGEWWCAEPFLPQPVRDMVGLAAHLWAPS